MKRHPSEKYEDYDDEEAPKRKSFSLLKGIFYTLLLLLVFAGAFAAVLTTVFIQEASKDLPTREEILGHQLSLTSIIYDRKEREIGRLFEENRTLTPLNQISPWMIKAIIAAEDGEFYDHSGIRISSIIRSAIIDITHQKKRQGGSTITQQLTRNLFLDRDKTLQRKAREAILAMRLERYYTKDQILEMYLNTIYLGHGAYGVGAAAQTYFGKPASDLTLPEASTLAGIVAAPEAYSPIRYPEKAKTRQEYVLGQMVERGMIDANEAEQTLKTPLTFKQRSGKASFQIKNAPYFVSYVLFNYLLPQYGAKGVYRGGLRVYTTIDLDVQEAAERVVSKMKFEGALVALDPATGEIIAMVGGRDFDKSKFNRATQAYRQPGSAFKPIVYATAIEHGYRPVDHILDAPLNFPNGWSPKNYDGKNNGEMTLIEALTRSINTVAVRLAQVVGIGALTDEARAMGITTKYLPNDLSLALGSTSVTPLEMAVAFSTFANNGYRVVPFGVREIRDSNGGVITQNGPTIDQAISPETAATMRSMLMQPVIWGTATRARIPDYQVFGKTGTTNDWTDAWFVGGVPGLVAVVYIGNDNHKKLYTKADGGILAAPVWKEFMAEAVKKLDLPKSFVVPPEVKVASVRVCRKTGYLAAAACPAVEILMPSDSVPDSQCPWHGGSAIAAKEDVNAPQLVLAPMDDEVKGKYMMAAAWNTAEPEEGAEDVAPPGDISTKRPQINETPLPPKNPNASPYQNDPTPAQEIEKRYQDLLKKYNIE